MDYAVGIDIGGTKIAAGVVDAQAHILSRYETKQHSGQPPAVVIKAAERAFRAVLQAAGMERADPVGVGVGFAGHTNGPQGLVLTSSNLPAWDRMPLRDVLSERLDVSVVLDNDCNAAALAEHRYGAGQGSRHMVYIAFSTGVGAGLIIDGRLYRGHNGAAGEVGHTVVDVDGRVCSCGKRGCLMAWACGMALAELTRERIHNTVQAQTYQACPYCQGRGKIKSEMTLCILAFRQLKRYLQSKQPRQVSLNLNPAVISLMEKYKNYIRNLEHRFRTKINLVSNPTQHLEEIKIT